MTKALAPPSGPTSEQCRHLNVSHSCLFLFRGDVPGEDGSTSGLLRDGDVARRCSGKDSDADGTAEDNAACVEAGDGFSAAPDNPDDDILGLLLALFAAVTSLPFTDAPVDPTTNDAVSSSLQCRRSVVRGSSSAGIWI
jgi:hypothetical protein